MPSSVSSNVQPLPDAWQGPLGGLPPLDRCTPGDLEAAVVAAAALKRDDLEAIAANPAAPTFQNTVEALEDSGQVLTRVSALFHVMASTAAVGEMAEVVKRLAPLLSSLEDALVQDERLVRRVQSVWADRQHAGLSAEQLRLVEVVHKRLHHRGAGVPPAAKKRLEEIHARLSQLSARYNQNLVDEAAEQAVFIDDESGVLGLPAVLRDAAVRAAQERGRAGQWAVPNQRTAVWPFLIHAQDRTRREQVWRMWTGRGAQEGAWDNRPLANEMLQLRGEKARLLGYPSFAHWVLAERMLETPQAAMDLLMGIWQRVKPVAEQQVAQYQALADREGAGIELAPWDRLYYAERLRREEFGVDALAVQAYLPLESVLAMMFEVASRVHGLSFVDLPEAPRADVSVRVYEVRRAGQPAGVLYVDLFARPGKMHGSYQQVYRDAQHFRERVLPISSINSSLAPPAPGQPVLLPWEYANVFFHEFGHALHMLLNGSAYPSLSSRRVAWDFVELPALLQERWLLDRDLLQRHARHHQTGEPIPLDLVDRIEAALRRDRPFSLNPDFLLPAIVDLHLHLLADGSGRPIDALAVEEKICAELGLPSAWDLIMRGTHNSHVFVGGQYAAGLYSYLWADLMAADAAEVFERAPGGLFDTQVGRRWGQEVLAAGHAVPALQAFRAFAGHDPQPGPLLRRYGLELVPG